MTKILSIKIFHYSRSHEVKQLSFLLYVEYKLYISIYHIRLLRVPWTARRSNQSILKISPACSLEGLMLKLKLKLQYFDHLMQRTDSFEKTLMLGKIEGRRRRGQQRMR